MCKICVCNIHTYTNMQKFTFTVSEALWNRKSSKNIRTHILFGQIERFTGSKLKKIKSGLSYLQNKWQSNSLRNTYLQISDNILTEVH